MTERMYPFLSHNHKKTGDTCNPLSGKCLHACPYCYVEVLKKMFPGVRAKYSGEPRIDNKQLADVSKFTAKDFVFLCDCTDLLGHWVPTSFIRQIFMEAANSPAKFLTVTKNPHRYSHYIRETTDQIPKNITLGCTIESDRDYIVCGQPRLLRLDYMKELSEVGYPVMISIEPIMDFSLDFISKIGEVNPKFVAVGYDNYNNGLPEPSLTKTSFLMERLVAAGITVYAKTIREKNAASFGKKETVMQP